MQSPGPLLITGGMIVAGFLLLGVNTINFFGHTCHFIGPMKFDRPQCIPPFVIVMMWLSAIGLIGLGAYRLATDYNSATTPTANKRKKDDFDRTRWNELVKFDPQIALVAEKLTPLGQKWIDEFARSYMILGDKQYLPAIVNKVIAQAREESERNTILAEQRSKLQTPSLLNALSSDISVIFKCPDQDGWIVGLRHSGKAAFVTDTTAEVYDSVNDYRSAKNDSSTWFEIKTERERQDFIRTHVIALADFQRKVS